MTRAEWSAIQSAIKQDGGSSRNEETIYAKAMKATAGELTEREMEWLREAHPHTAKLIARLIEQPLITPKSKQPSLF